uniref:Tr-type G domain-containing protein n=1 Tax=Rhabditophanes sp. KR3021 TaxID=114890 RepID=A0AC35UHV5_9BILA
MAGTNFLGSEYLQKQSMKSLVSRKENEHCQDSIFSLPPEVEMGNVEYKARLVNVTSTRIQHLVSQMKWRLEEGKGEAFYELGVDDNGLISGLTDCELNESLVTLHKMAKELNARISIINEREVPISSKSLVRRRMIEVFVEQECVPENIKEIRIGILGAADAGKSTLCGVLTHGELDNSHGSARINLFRHLHEFKTGKTSSICLDVLGFDKFDKLLNQKEYTLEALMRKSDRILTLIDLAGDRKYLKTTIYGISSYIPNICCLVISAVTGPTAITREHLGYVSALNIPFFVVITKIDAVTPKHYEKVVQSVEHLIKKISQDKKMFMIESVEDAIANAQDIVNGSSLVPIIAISSVTGANMSKLICFLSKLNFDKPFENKLKTDPMFRVEELFNITGVGLIVCGTLLEGTINEGDVVCFGPANKESFVNAKIESIHRKKQPVRVLNAGETASLAINIEGDCQNYKNNLRRIVISMLGQILLTIAICITTSYYVMFVVALKFFPKLIHNFFYMNFTTKIMKSFIDPAGSGVNHLTRNFYLEVSQGMKMGVWHSLPQIQSDLLKKLSYKKNEKKIFEELLRNESFKVVIYCHGASGYRGNMKCLKLMNMLSDQNVHTFVLDYRGYADSHGFICEVGLYEDLMVLFSYVNTFAPNRVYVWGHSMGCSLVSKCASLLSEMDVGLRGVILESPFTNAYDAIYSHPFLWPFKFSTQVLNLICREATRDSISMKNDENVIKINCPIILLHSKDDMIIPYQMSQTLYDIGISQSLDIELFLFDESFQLGHTKIIYTSECAQIISSFMDKT